MKSNLHWQGLWTGTGILMIAGVIGGSLLSVPQVVDVEGVDKAHHLLAYGLLMYWWGMLHPLRRLPWALALCGLGLLLEFTQSQIPHRFMEWPDAAANVAGVMLALALLVTPAGGLLSWLDSKLADRLDPGGS